LNAPLKADEMRKNAIPAVIAFAPALLLPLFQDVLRPRISHASWLGFVLSWTPDLVVGFCFPFSILVRPRAWTARVAAKLFRIWSALTVVALLLDEFLSPFGPNVFDPFDIAAGVGGVVVAGLVFHKLVRGRLTFADEEPALGTGEVAGV
jgi:hypothetical protein